MNQENKAPPYNIVLVGCGKMGSAILDAWVRNDLIKYALVIDPSDLPEIFQNNKIIFHTRRAPDKFEQKPDAIILAVKPQILKAASQELRPAISEKTPILSIAAGQSLKTLEENFKKGQPIIRAMPNTPAAISKGMSVAIGNPYIDKTQQKIADRLFKATGLTHWIEDETMMDAVTALSGSGPAYVFLLIEILAKSGEKLGLPKDMAMTLARQTVIGSAALAELENHTPAAQLRKNVTSPGGTTEAALNVLMAGKIQEVFDTALLAAQKRGKELNNQT